MFAIGAFAIVLNQHGRVLLCHRRDIDLWNRPGGGVERGEAPWDAVVREVREETGLEVVVERIRDTSATKGSVVLREQHGPSSRARAGRMARNRG